jgi:hypothetical protein
VNLASEGCRSDLVVDASTGAILVGSSVRFVPHGALPSNIATDVLALGAVRDMRTGYFWHDFTGALFANRPCLLSVCTFGPEVVHIQIKFMRENESAPVWADHSAVLREIALGRATLAAQLGKSFATGTEWFPWGVAWSQYDDKSGGIPSIGVRYDLDRQ